MRATVRGVASLVLGLGGIVLLGIGIDHVLDSGSCSSGGPYISRNACPDDSWKWAVLLAAGFPLMMAGMFLSEAGLVRPGSGQVIWTGAFTGGGIALLVKVLTQPDLPADSKLGAVIVAALFIPMGLAVGVAGLVQLARRRRLRKPEPEPVLSPQQRLNRLRSMGLLTREEFEQLRDRDPDRLAEVAELAGRRESGILTEAEFDRHKQAALRR